MRGMTRAIGWIITAMGSCPRSRNPPKRPKEAAGDLDGDEGRTRRQGRR